MNPITMNCSGGVRVPEKRLGLYPPSNQPPNLSGRSHWIDRADEIGELIQIGLG